MIAADFHIHTTFCDGKNTPEEMVLSAISMGCTDIGFSGHSPLPDEDWCMSESDVGKYFSEIHRLRDKYADAIRIYCGIEQDYFSEPPAYPFDYVIGSVHYVERNGRKIAVDESAQLLHDAVNSEYGGNYYSFCEDYYALVADLFRRTKCDIIGHFDLCTKFNEGGNVFDESDGRYMNAARSAADALLSSTALFELNTGAISRGYRTAPYPSQQLILYIAQHGGSFIKSSDAHSCSGIMYGFNHIDMPKNADGSADFLRRLNR